MFINLYYLFKKAIINIYICYILLSNNVALTKLKIKDLINLKSLLS